VNDDASKDKIFGILGRNWIIGFSDDKIIDPFHLGIKTIGDAPTS
jgi:hypothetical protein